MGRTPNQYRKGRQSARTLARLARERYAARTSAAREPDNAAVAHEGRPTTPQSSSLEEAAERPGSSLAAEMLRPLDLPEQAAEPPQSLNPAVAAARSDPPEGSGLVDPAEPLEQSPRVELVDAPVPEQAARSPILEEPVAPVEFNNFSMHAGVFDSAMRAIEFATCVRCKKQTMRQDLHQVTFWCSSCRRINNDLYSTENGMDLGEVPVVLQDLTMIEQVLIARVHPVVSVYNIRGQQRGYSGHVMNFVHHMEQIARKLPQPIEALNSVVLLHRHTPSGLIQFRVRSGRVLEALQWLKSNNRYYRDIEIDFNVVANLPTDDDISSQLHVLDNQQEAVPEENPDNLIFASCFPNLPNIDAQERIRAALRQSQATENRDVGSWPNISQNPVNEFTSEGYICKAFPTLFPYGRGDLNEPRLQKISRHNYFKYLMRYCDGRFAKDERFPYFAYNSVARWDAMNCGDVYIRQHNMEGFDAGDIRNMAEDENQDIAGSIMYYGQNLRGTRSYWKQRCAELVQMVRQLGIPTIFFTLSAADYHWPDLYRLLCPRVNPATLSERQRALIMHNNPNTVAWFFKHRCEQFLKLFLLRFFPVTDFWYRYEWQSRGSPHIHGVLWMKDAPDCNDLDSLSDESRSRVAVYFANLISATVGRQMQIPARDSPCRKRFTDIPAESHNIDIDRILNSVQMHSRCGRHCMRRKRGSREEVCRFGFPQTLEPEPVVRREGGSWRFFPQRNNQLLQRHNKHIAQVWRANTDFSAITSKDAFISYIAKYASKAEYASIDYADVLKAVISHNPSDAPASRLVRQLINTSVAERNFSAQEVVHLINGWKLYASSRTMSVLSLTGWRRLNERDQSKTLTDYSTRPSAFDDITLLDYARWFYKRRDGTTNIRAKEHIVRIVPYLKFNPEAPDNNEAYYIQQCKLHIPWRNCFENLLPDGMSWRELYEVQIQQVVFPDPFGAQFPHDPDADEYEQDEPVAADVIRDPGMAAARMEPGNRQNDPLGRRVIDEAYDWMDCNQTALRIDEIEEYRQTYSSTPPVRHVAVDVIDPSQLSTKQREVFELVQQQATNSTEVKRTIVQGKAGTGKSAIIKLICEYLNEIQMGFEILAPTGAAAVNVDGKTIHSFFRIPISGQMLELNGEGLRLFQLRMRNLKFLIIDEYSMIGLRLLHKIHLRLCQGKNSSESFGGVYMYLFGDLRQLPPVLDLPIYADAQDPFARRSIELVSSIQKRIVLDAVHRQAASESRFKLILDNVGTTNVSEDDWRLLIERRESVNPPGFEAFNDAIHLYPTNKLVKEFNTVKLSELRLPIALIEAVHNNTTARQAPDTLAGGLQKQLLLSIGCRIMLRKNINVERGLVNGSLGTVRNIIYNRGERPPLMPYCLLISFDKFSGPHLHDADSQYDVFPLLPSSSSWKEHSVDCTRTQFPINLAYALTIHKAQGLTMDKAVIDIGEKELSIGLTYVALSRVRRLSDIIFSRSFDFSRLFNLRNMRQVMPRERFLSAMDRAELQNANAPQQHSAEHAEIAYPNLGFAPSNSLYPDLHLDSSDFSE